jgi:hypothetical protein
MFEIYGAEPVRFTIEDFNHVRASAGCQAAALCQHCRLPGSRILWRVAQRPLSLLASHDMCFFVTAAPAQQVQKRNDVHQQHFEDDSSMVNSNSAAHTML